MLSLIQPAMRPSLCVLLPLFVILDAVATPPETSASGQVLYNGIHLSAPWPPPRTPSREPMDVPYLASPPAVIPIDTGRQLFVDDFLVEQSTLRRTHHKTIWFPDNPVLKPDKSWEQEGESQGHPAPTAMVFSDGVWYNARDALFKMWYMAGYAKRTCYAVSKDGIHWNKPALDVVPNTNIVHTTSRDSGTVWLDQSDPDPQRRFKMFIYAYPEGRGALSIYFSPDGIHWSDRVTRSGPTGDRSTVFYNALRNVWVYSIRDGRDGLGRTRAYREDPDVLKAAVWEKGEPPFWVGADRLDPPRADLNTPCELYNLDAVAYESVLLGLFSIWRGQPTDRAKPNEVCVGFSRDGFHWYRPMRDAFIGVSETPGAWNWANVQSAGGCCLIVSDKLYFYVSGRQGVAGSPASGVSSTGLALLRRDGFTSMDADAAGGTLLTRPVRFSGKRLFVNVAASEGELRAEVLDADGKPIAPYILENCTAVHADKTSVEIRWKGTDDLAPLAGKPVRVRFHLRKGSLYAFWVTPDVTGASHGYTAAGGPDLPGPTDTVGSSE